MRHGVAPESPRSRHKPRPRGRHGGATRPARAVAETAGRHIGRPVARPADKIDHARLLKAQGHTLGQVAAKTGIPKISLHRHLAEAPAKARE
ncbi:hypothetical protein AB0F88_29385 [Streptosporangium sp. NPDC023963]|uniref:hypothetical protein n=1 Tax=Streptosporangium sp. NPDC023963 TaxID=3155608 RepID=UPI003446507B